MTDVEPKNIGRRFVHNNGAVATLVEIDDGRFKMKTDTGLVNWFYIKSSWSLDVRNVAPK